MKIDGGCQCGDITYEANADPEKVFICHCTDCQALSASAFRTIIPVPEDDFRIISGEPKIYVKDGGQRRETHAGVLPRMRLGHLLDVRR